MPPHVSLRQISKRFGGAHALRAVDLDIERGSIHGLVGENGAGKSTLGKIITGVIQADAGTLEVDGRRVHYRAPREALDDGLAIIAQELSLVPQLTVLENVLLGQEPNRAGVLDARRLRRRFEERLEGMRFELPLNAPVGTLRLADQQKVEIMRAVARQARLIVMDEPTASLTPDERARLFETVRHLKGDGTTVVFVSHALHDVLDLSDTVTILRDGQVVRTAPAAEETVESLVNAMIGRSFDASFPPKRPPAPDAPVIFEARKVSAGALVRDVSFSVRAGEIVALAGLIGSGRSEVARAVFGADPRTGGSIHLDGEEVRIRSPRDGVRRGLAMLPESRKDQGLMMMSPVSHNVSLACLETLQRFGVVRTREEAKRVRAEIERVDVRGAGMATAVRSLSGGNQQKVLFAKWLLRRPRLLIADEPTRGVDVGAKRAIYELLAGLAADEGLGVIVISSELEEVLGLAHRVIVMREGRAVGELEGDDMTEERILRLAFGTGARRHAA
ncbi:MAG TPA: sugar ABC transporter ATP-binding protein [Solirubrobacteraceae bacterium]